jgi:hypothetical protein
MKNAIRLIAASAFMVCAGPAFSQNSPNRRTTQCGATVGLWNGGGAAGFAGAGAVPRAKRAQTRLPRRHSSSRRWMLHWRRPSAMRSRANGRAYRPVRAVPALRQGRQDHRLAGPRRTGAARAGLCPHHRHGGAHPGHAHQPGGFWPDASARAKRAEREAQSQAIEQFKVRAATLTQAFGFAGYTPARGVVSAAGEMPGPGPHDGHGGQDGAHGR